VKRSWPQPEGDARGRPVPAGRWVVVDPATWSRDEITVAGEDYHHLVRVLRLREGDAVGVLDGVGGRARAELAALTGQAAVLRVRERARAEAPRPRVTLCQAVLREGPMDAVVQAAVELGAARILPVATERAVAKYAGRKAETRRERWLRIVWAAARQCGQAWLPDVEPVLSIQEALKRTSESCLRIWGSLGAEARLLRKALRGGSGPPEAVAVFIGPEGDFTPEEELLMRQAGAEPVSFGGGVLRADTAALFALSALRYEFGSPPR
jgi:16S rRNA (uracil1498-N3)-methyltransferase